MRTAEASGKTRKEAIQHALDELDVELHQVEIEILDEGSKGIFGIGARNVKVKVSTDVPGKAPRQRRGAPAGKPAINDRRNHEQKPSGSAKPAREPEAEGAAKPVPTQLGNEAAALLREIIERMGIEAQVEYQASENGGVHLNVTSPDSAILIGRRGRTLHAIQYLVNRMVQSEGDPDQEGRIIVDVEGYLDRRRESLESMALNLARRAKDTGRNVRVKPLNARERRIVHLALQDDPDVRTFSTGDSLLRTVVIAPSGSGNQERPPRRSNRGGGQREGRPRSGRGRNGSGNR